MSNRPFCRLYLLVSFLSLLTLLGCTKNEDLTLMLDTFGANDSYAAGSGWSLGYSYSFPWYHAIGFSPDISGSVLKYEIAVLRHHGGNQLNAWLVSDNNGSPGGLIEQFSFSVPSGSEDLMLSANSSINPALIKGTRYWLVVAPPDINNELFGWYRNPKISGITDAQSNSQNGPWTLLGEDYAPTLRITGKSQ